MMLLRTIFVSAVVPNFCQRMPAAMRLASFIRSRLIRTEVGIITFYIEARTKNYPMFDPISSFSNFLSERNMKITSL